MASKAVKMVRFTVWWLLVPAIFAATGYYIVGPRLGAAPDPKVVAPSAGGEDGPSEVESETPSKNYQAPKIEVSVKKGSTVTQSEIRRPRRKKKPAPKPTAPAATAPSEPAASPPPDTGGAGGGETVPVGDGQ